MHINRSLYTLDEYQSKLKQQSKTMRLFLENKSTGEQFYFKPTIRSIWVEKFRKAYLKERSDKLKIRLNRNDLSFLTLTYWTELYTAEEVASRHKSDINIFIKECRKLMPSFAYSYVVEVTKKNYVHFHLFVKDGLFIKQYRRIWKAITGAWRLTLTKINSTKMAIAYVNKYVTKLVEEGTNQLEFMWNFIDRFFASSRNFFRKSTDTGHISLYRLVAMFFGDLDIVEQADESCSWYGFLDIRQFFTGLSDTDRLIQFNLTDKDFLFANCKSFINSDHKVSYYKQVIDRFNFNIVDMFDQGFQVDVWDTK